jgi:hypothetical protein
VERLRVFKTRIFGRFARKAGISDEALRAAVGDMARGLVDADLGGGVFKQRVARPGEGKSGGFRTIIVLQVRKYGVFVYGFGKNERDNISESELSDFKKLAVAFMSYSDDEIAAAVTSGAWIEVNDGEAVS